MLGVANAGPSAHDLDVAGLGPTEASDRVPVNYCARANIADDLHVFVAVKIEACARSDLIIVPDDESAERFVVGVAPRRDPEMTASLQPPKGASR